MRTTILLLILACSLIGLRVCWQTNVSAQVSDTNANDLKNLSTPHSAEKANVQTPPKRLPEVPSVEITLEDKTASQAFQGKGLSAEQIDTEYATLKKSLINPSDNSIESLLECSELLENNGEAAISAARHNLEIITREASLASSWDKYEEYVDAYRSNILVIALALEFKGDYVNAERTRDLIYAYDAAEARNFRLRASYALTLDRMKRSPLDSDYEIRQLVFTEICDYVYEQTYNVSIDDVLMKLAETTNDQGASKLTSLSLQDARILDVYRLRNECAKIANPRLHYCALQSDEVTELTRKSYAQFLESMEKLYLGAQKDRWMHVSKKEEATMSLLRRLVELPY